MLRNNISWNPSYEQKEYTVCSYHQRAVATYDIHLMIIQSDTTTIKTTVNKFLLSSTQILKSYKKIISQTAKRISSNKIENQSNK